MDEFGSLAPVIRRISAQDDGMILIRSLITFPAQFTAEMYDADENLVFVPNHKRQRVESLNLRDLPQAIERNPNSLELIALATELRREGLIDSCYRQECFPGRPMPDGFVDPRMARGSVAMPC